MKPSRQVQAYQTQPTSLSLSGRKATYSLELTLLGKCWTTDVAHKKPRLDWGLHCWIEMTDGSIRDPDADSRIETALDGAYHL